eukprot:CAMPEP_0174828088 /NCGR_PEP_ID=MMETSP1114-20130205/1124_1 /TAXON_ID=312471 /ORGANISM="Neobodo designis, Strain CCAP 1951/1" /LENGTH=132 /DNA_ID=CAMNT_0016061793 /DNA_START=73 /DNA_END=471 /DNA_ORIENTATION=+
MTVDTAENRQYIQKHRVWILGDAITCCLMTQRPKDPIAAAIGVLEGQKGRLQAPPNQPSADDCSEAKGYLEEHRIATVIEDWMRTLVDTKPADAVEWSIEYFNKLSGDDDKPAARKEEPAPSAEEAAAADLL